MTQNPFTPAAPVIRGRVKTIIRLRINSDGDGVRSVVFLYGCPLSCKWCCNPETRVGNEYQSLTPGQLLGFLDRDRIYFRESGGGVTFSGGEPLMQYAFIREFSRLAGTDFPINIETSLHAPREAVAALAPLIHHWFVDFKAPSDEDHVAFTGVPRGQILENLQWLVSRVGAERITITCPIIPGFTDSGEYVAALTGKMRELGLTTAELHPHRKHSEAKYAPLGLESAGIPGLSEERLSQIRTALKDAGIRTEGKPPCTERRKCDVLKEIRRIVSVRYGIPVEIPECGFRGKCPGTCPQCEKELDTINNWLRLHGTPPGAQELSPSD